MKVRSYQPKDYDQVKSLYLDASTFGGQFDEARDSADRLRRKVENDPDAILVAEDDGKIAGTVSLIDDGRVAWLFRFAALPNQYKVLQALHDEAMMLLKRRGHTQVLVYTPVGDAELNNRYEHLGFAKGADYTCYWKKLL